MLPALLPLPRLLALATFFCGCIIVGLFTTSFFRLLPSVGMAGVALTALVCYVRFKASYVRVGGGAYAGFALIYLLHVASGLLTSSANWSSYQQDVVLQLPFLVLPLAFWLLPPLPSQYLRRLWLWLILVTVGASLLSTGNYLLHAQEINESYLRSKVMFTEPDHIRFSLLITLSIAASGSLLYHSSATSRTRPWLLSAMGWLALYQHMLAVRSGLLSLYIIGALAVVWLLFSRRRYVLAMWLVTLLLTLPIISYVCFPTFRNRLAITQQDAGRVRHTASANNYSLVGRVYSYRAALLVLQDNLLWGVGKADMQTEIAERYRRAFPNIRPAAYILPHNQYLYSSVAFGLVGALVFVIGFYYAGLYAWPRYAPLLLAQYVIVTLSFLVEYTLETQVGIAFSLFFLLLALEGTKLPSIPEVEWRPA